VYREKKLSLAQYTECKKELMADFQDFSVCDLTPEVLGRAIDCIENASLRTLDALQVACALSAEVDCFASSDQQQLKAANKAGLKVVHV
jgi:predicted nucleic acid-binding protein